VEKAVPSTYRIYSLSERDVITGAFDQEFDGDADAVDQARCYLVAYSAVEIWDLDRLVDRLDRAPIEAPEPDGGMAAAPTREDARLMLDDINSQVGALARLRRRRIGAGTASEPWGSRSSHLGRACGKVRIP
jgi:hypothetical protein